ncbi:MAG: HAMP domain-containing protein [Duodenibacillus sp.]|nr:HAMP domain-containing protein [Duodenibacillus sp.]
MDAPAPPRHGGFFLKLFLGLWAALVAVGAGIWTLSSAWQSGGKAADQPFDRSRQAVRALSTATGIHRWAGDEALKAWLSDPRCNMRPVVFAIDEAGREITGRILPEKVSAALQHELESELVVPVTTEAGTVRLIAVRTRTPPPMLAIFLRHTPLWALAALAVLMTTLIAGSLAWHFTRPVKRLRWAMQQASRGDLAVRVAPELGRAPDELGELARQFDAMAEQINALMARQRRLLHDVSHELRSPLARMSVAVAIARRNPERTQEMIGRLEGDVTKLDNLIGELLSYARMEDGKTLAMEPADLSSVLAGVAEDTNFEGSPRGITAVCRCEEGLALTGNTEALGHAFENFARNALKYSPGGGVITIAARREGGRITASVEDQGPGMKPGELERIFLPFVRGSDQATGTGFGLGLALAKRIIERHGGAVRAENAQPQGLRIVVDLPAAAPEGPEGA